MAIGELQDSENPAVSLFDAQHIGTFNLHAVRPWEWHGEKLSSFRLTDVQPSPEFS